MRSGRVEGWATSAVAVPETYLWHPEDTAGTDAVQQRLFDAFVNEVGRRSVSRRQ
jgi:hypothetical protein